MLLRFGRLVCVGAVGWLLTTGGIVHGQISYSVVDSIYTQDFNSLPTDFPQNASIETVYTDGWRDNTTTVAGTHVSLPGWYLYHPLSPSSENGFNGHQRLRVGPGANTGAFWLFGDAASNPEKALGSVGATTVAGNGANMYMGLHLINDTGQTLTGFSVAYDGEQWRDGQSSSPETLLFDYSLSATELDWFDPNASFTPVGSLNFTAPVSGGTTTSGSPVDGNALGRVSDIHAVISDITWNPGQSLWLRWGDPQLASAADDGLAIDNVRFSTGSLGIGGPSEITSVASGFASSPSTWSNNQAPASGNLYRVVSGHTVTVDYTDFAGGSPFPGNELRINDGGVAHFNASGVHVPLLILETGANITESVSGDFALGDIFAPSLGLLQTLADVSFDIDAGSNFFLDMTVQGTGNFDFNAGSNSQLWLSAAGGHAGTIRFNGSGSRVLLVETQTFGTLEMNSTGDNVLYYNPTGQADTGTVIFNQPGTIDHAATQTSPVRRLHGVNFLEANAAVTVDLTRGFPNNDAGAQTEERRFQVATGMRGAADVTVNGTATDFSNGTNISVNEFEVGSTGEPSSLSTSTYSGTLTANDFVNVEIRQNFRNARFVVNSNARLEMGHQAVNANHSIELGEIVVNSGGILEVGFEQSYSSTLSTPNTGHHIYTLTLTDTEDRDGSLTVNSGGTLRMQVNGTEAGQFDKILASGNVQLGGTLNVLVNPDATTGSGGRADNVKWTPTIGDTFDILEIVGGGAPAPGDYDGSGVVDDADHAFWMNNFGGTNAAADGNGNGVVDAADYVLWRKNIGASGGGSTSEITGTFDNVAITDFNGAMSGFAFQVNYTATTVQLQVVAAGSGAFNVAVPEPATFTMLTLLTVTLSLRRRRRI